MSAELLACPFCRQLFPSGEAENCPECGIALKPLAKLPPSHDALAEDPPEAVPPHLQTLPWTFFGRGRGALAVLGLLGLGAFFAPWVQERAPELLTHSGFDHAIRLRWIFAAGIAFLVMVPLVLSRRTVHAMRGARFAVGFLSVVALLTVLMRLVFTPSRTTIVPVRYEWGWGLYACGAIAIMTLVSALRFGGGVDSFDDLPESSRSPSRRR